MNWNNAKSIQPQNNQEVLIRIKGHLSTAVFDKDKNGYKLSDGSVCRPQFDAIEWMAHSKN